MGPTLDRYCTEARLRVKLILRWGRWALPVGAGDCQCQPCRHADAMLIGCRLDVMIMVLEQPLTVEPYTSRTVPVLW